MRSRFDYVKYDEKALNDQAALKEAFIDIEQMVNNSLQNGRAKALVLTKLEEAYMWCGKDIRDACVARAEEKDILQEGRGNE